MALKAPFHKQRVLSPRHRHLIDWSMASRALHSLMYMDAVIEIDKIRQIVDPRPLERAIFAIARPHRLQRRAIRPYLRVAVHAYLRGRDAGEGALLHRCVTVPAVNTNSGYVMLVTERYRLIAHDARFGKVRRTDYYAGHSRQGRNYENRAEDADTRQRIRTAVKNLSHNYSSAALSCARSVPGCRGAL